MRNYRNVKVWMMYLVVSEQWDILGFIFMYIASFGGGDPRLKTIFRTYASPIGEMERYPD